MIARLLLTSLLMLSHAPEARYDAVIPGLEAWPFTTAEATVFSAAGELQLYDSPGGSVVAVLPEFDFLGHPSVVVELDRTAGWSRVLTPARKTLPSMGASAAQTTGWVQNSLLTSGRRLTRSIVVNVGARTLSILSEGTVERSFGVGVGTPGTPTPTAVTGYLEERYLDPAQGEARYRVQLTSIHSAASDEPYGGDDGGLIALHFDSAARGAVSHGCIRLTSAAIAAVDELPLGTLVTLLP